jgi:pyruvyltransferase
MNTYWCKTYNNKNSNFGDILTPFILDTYKIPYTYSEKDIKFYGIGSILDGVSENYDGFVWSSGFLLQPKSKKIFKRAPLAIRGKYTLSCIQYNNAPIALGDGGLIMSNIYIPKIEKKYKLGIIPHYVDIDWVEFDIRTFSVFSTPDVLFIDPKDTISNYIDKLNSCENILSSSLHGSVMSDSYKINNGMFQTSISKKSLHLNKGSYKFKDYFSAFNQPPPPVLDLNEKTTIEQCISHCKEFNKPNMDVLKYYLEKCLIDFKVDE